MKFNLSPTHKSNCVMIGPRLDGPRYGHAISEHHIDFLKSTQGSFWYWFEQKTAHYVPHDFDDMLISVFLIQRSIDPFAGDGIVINLLQPREIA